MTTKENTGRLLSLDALRGFDMMFIMGLSAIIANFCGLFPGGGDCWLATQMSHVDWEGFHHHDTIFALFLFISGMTFPFSSAKKMTKGMSRSRLCLDVLRRACVLIFLGLVYQGIFQFHFATLRFPSVLARIGIAWAVAAILYMYTGKKTQWGIAVGILVGYFLLLRFFVAPDAPVGADSFSKEGNIAYYIDRILMPNHIYKKGLGDPEGLLSTIPAVVTAMLGMFIGRYVKDSKDSGNRSCAYGRHRCRMVYLVSGCQEPVDQHFRPCRRGLVSRPLRHILLSHRCQRLAQRRSVLPGCRHELDHHLPGAGHLAF